jgi:hypothetical protein
MIQNFVGLRGTYVRRTRQRCDPDRGDTDTLAHSHDSEGRQNRVACEHFIYGSAAHRFAPAVDIVANDSECPPALQFLVARSAYRSGWTATTRPPCGWIILTTVVNGSALSGQLMYGFSQLAPPMTLASRPEDDIAGTLKGAPIRVNYNNIPLRGALAPVKRPHSPRRSRKNCRVSGDSRSIASAPSNATSCREWPDCALRATFQRARRTAGNSSKLSAANPAPVRKVAAAPWLCHNTPAIPRRRLGEPLDQAEHHRARTDHADQEHRQQAVDQLRGGVHAQAHDAEHHDLAWQPLAHRSRSPGAPAHCMLDCRALPAWTMRAHRLFVDSCYLLFELNQKDIRAVTP